MMSLERSPHTASLLPPELAKPFTWKDLFGNDEPVEVEIGCGKGRFLMARALENPGVNFLGIDRVIKWLKRRIRQTGKVSNLKFFKAEGFELMKNIQPESVRAFHIYFPDPWPKRRHRGRRLVDEKYLLSLYERLVPGGSIYMATDFQDYFEQMKKSANLLTVPCAIRESNERMIGPEKTNYELKFAAQGLPLYYLEVKK